MNKGYISTPINILTCVPQVRDSSLEMSLGYGKCIILQLKDYEVRSLIWLNKLSFSQ